MEKTAKPAPAMMPPYSDEEGIVEGFPTSFGSQLQPVHEFHHNSMSSPIAARSVKRSVLPARAMGQKCQNLAPNALASAAKATIGGMPRTAETPLTER